MGKKIKPVDFLSLFSLMLALMLIGMTLIGKYLVSKYSVVFLLFLVSLTSFILISGITGSVYANVSRFLALSLLTIWAYQTIAYIDLLQMDPIYIESFLLNTVLDSVIIVVFDALLLAVPRFRDRIAR